MKGFSFVKQRGFTAQTDPFGHKKSPLMVMQRGLA